MLNTEHNYCIFYISMNYDHVFTISLKKHVTGPWFLWNSKYIWVVFMLKWNLDKARNMLKFEFQLWLNVESTVENWGSMA